MIGEGGVESLKKLNYMITFGYKILFLLVGPIFEEGGEGYRKLLQEAQILGIFSIEGGPM